MVNKVKNRFLKYFLCGLLGIICLLLIGAAAFYFLMLKPRIDVVMTVGSVFADTAGEGDVCRLEFEGGQEILLNLKDEETLDGAVYMDQAVYDGLEFGYRNEGIWLRFPKVSSKYYLLPWTDDVQDQIENSTLISMLKLQDEEQEALATALLELREEFTEEQYDFTPTLLNRLLGLQCLKADIWELYRGISFSKAGTEMVTRGAEMLSCAKYDLEIPEEYVKPLLKTDGAGNLLNALGDLLGDMTLEVYIYKGALVYVDVETSILKMPQMDFQKLISGAFDEAFSQTKTVRVPLTGRISVRADGVLEIEAETRISEVPVEAACTLEMIESASVPCYDPDEALNVFQVGKLRLLLEAKKWEDAIDGKDID